MQDFGFRFAFPLLFSGVLVFLAFLFYSALYPRKVAAAASAPAPAASQAQRYGMLEPVAHPLEWALRQVEARVTRRTGRSRWGWAIVVTTFLINLLLLPFRVLAMRAAKTMQALKPELDAIQARSGTQDQAKQSREIEALFRKHKTNPLSGCIPALAPWVVLMAFYSVLTGLAELHGAPWLWVADLSRPEQLPVRVLPLLMIATQLILGKITPNASTDARMNRLMVLMPLVFGFILYRQPAALMLYWVSGNLLALAQQWWLSRRYA